MLTQNEIDIIQNVKRRQGTGDPAMPYLPISPRLQTLIDRGYLKCSPAFSPLVGKIDGEFVLSVTEAGNIALIKETNS